MGQTHTIGKHCTTVKGNRHNLRVTYHSTDVVTVNNGVVTLDTGGHFTNTTKARMNQASNEYGLGYQVFQNKFKWYVKTNIAVLEFDGNTITI
jgi:hypothetical protein